MPPDEQEGFHTPQEGPTTPPELLQAYKALRTADEQPGLTGCAALAAEDSGAEESGAAEALEALEAGQGADEDEHGDPERKRPKKKRRRVRKRCSEAPEGEEHEATEEGT